MNSLDTTQRVWALTIQRFAEIVYVRRGTSRYASLLLVPVFVAIAVPGWWWAICAIGTGSAILVERRRQRALFWAKISFADCSEADIQRILSRQSMVMGALTALYVAPYGLLALAPAPGPLLGLLFCAGAEIGRAHV